MASARPVLESCDETGSPWTLVVHVDARGDEGQRDALAEIMLGERGGDQVLRLPWVSKHAPGGYRLEVGNSVALAATRPFAEEGVRCGIPGVDDSPFTWELAGNCAFASTFDYHG